NIHLKNPKGGAAAIISFAHRSDEESCSSSILLFFSLLLLFDLCCKKERPTPIEGHSQIRVCLLSRHRRGGWQNRGIMHPGVQQPSGLQFTATTIIHPPTTTIAEAAASFQLLSFIE
ncbi:unnamed protein product, partial [Heterosigma akashiwo]